MVVFIVRTGWKDMNLQGASHAQSYHLSPLGSRLPLKRKISNHWKAGVVFLCMTNPITSPNLFNWGGGLLPSRAMDFALFTFYHMFFIDMDAIPWTSCNIHSTRMELSMRRDGPWSSQELLRLWVVTWLYERTTFCPMMSCWWGVGPRCCSWKVWHDSRLWFGSNWL